MKITKLVPWLVKAAGTYWGEYFFVEVRTDEGVTGWGEITTTTKIANRAVAGIIRELNEILVGEDPSQIERLWHKTFRSFTYTGSRGATTNVISGIDIALWDIRGKVLDQPIYQLLGGKVRDDILLYTHPNSRNFGTDEGVVKEIRAIVDSGHTALKFDPFPHLNRIGAADDIYLDGGMSKQGEKIAAKLTARIREIAGPDVEILIDAHGRFNVPTAIRLCRSLEDAGQIDWFEEPVPVESYHALHQVREKVNAHISVGERLHTRCENPADTRKPPHRLPDARRDVDRRDHRTEEDRHAGRGVLHPGLATRCKRSDQCCCRRACHDVNAELLPAGDIALGSVQLQRLHHCAPRQQRWPAEGAPKAWARHRDEHGLPAWQRCGRIRRDLAAMPAP